MAYRIKIASRIDKDIRRLLGSQIGRAIGCLSGVLEEGGSSIHATRKCLKRCRSILRLAKPSLAPKDFRAHDRAFRDIARLLSHDRDREVMADTLAMLASKAIGDEKAALAAGMTSLDTQQQNGTAVLSDGDNIALAVTRLQECDHAVMQLRFHRTRRFALAEGFRESYAQARRALRKAYRAGDDESFHDFRKALQHHWRQCQLLSPVWPEIMSVRIAAAHELSQMIGTDHDLSLVTARFSDPSRSSLDEATRTAICTAARAEQARIRQDAEPLARRLFAVKPSDMERMVLALWPAAIRLARHRRKEGAPERPPDEAVH
jgi:CHAD domain-containing protein